MKALVVILALYAFSAQAGTECVWIPVCTPMSPVGFGIDTPEALRVFLNAELELEIRPWWGVPGEQSSFWLCGDRSAAVQVSIAYASGESIRSAALPPDAALYPGPGACRDAALAAPSPSPNPFLLGAYYGPWEQAFRSVRASFAGERIDVNQDGKIDMSDQLILEQVAAGVFGQPKFNELCLPWLNQPCP